MYSMAAPVQQTSCIGPSAREKRHPQDDKPIRRFSAMGFVLARWATCKWLKGHGTLRGAAGYTIWYQERVSLAWRRSPQEGPFPAQEMAS